MEVRVTLEDTSPLHPMSSAVSVPVNVELSVVYAFYAPSWRVSIVTLPLIVYLGCGLKGMG